MTVSDWINLSLSILSFILAVISVVTVVITLRQNHKMIEESNRPYITVYGDETNFSTHPSCGKPIQKKTRDRLEIGLVFPYLI